MKRLQSYKGENVVDDLIKRLEEYGCDMEGTMERFLDDKKMYFICLNQMLEDPAFEELGKALSEKQIEAAFDYAHTLKGVLANMGIIPIYNIVIQIVEPLRVGQCDNLMPVYKILIRKLKELKKLIHETMVQ